MQNITYPKCTRVSNGAPSIITNIPISLYKPSESAPFMSAEQFVLTIQVVGYFPAVYHFSGILSETLEKDIYIGMIPLTDANAEKYNNTEQLRLIMKLDPDDGTLTFTLFGLYNTNILSIDKKTDGHACITGDTVIMSLEKVC